MPVIDSIAIGIDESIGTAIIILEVIAIFGLERAFVFPVGDGIAITVSISIGAAVAIFKSLVIFRTFFAEISAIRNAIAVGIFSAGIDFAWFRFGLRFGAWLGFAEAFPEFFFLSKGFHFFVDEIGPFESALNVPFSV